MRSKAQPRADEARAGRFRDMLWVVRDVLVPMERPEAPTVFRLDEQAIFDNLVSQIQRDCPALGRTLGVKEEAPGGQTDQT
jgi:hypothetical protein